MNEMNKDATILENQSSFIAIFRTIFSFKYRPNYAILTQKP